MNDRKKESLVLFSGGIDSKAALLWMLDNTDDNIEVHHIILKDRSNRWELELEACDKIFKWMTKNKRSFEYTESIIGSAKLVPLTIGTFILLVNNSYDQTASQFHIT